MKYEYKTSAAYRGYGWIEPLTDPEDSLIEDYVARRICDELNAMQAEIASLRAALEQAQEDAAEAKQNGYELGLLAASQGAAREDGWQPIETAPKDGNEVILFDPDYLQRSGFEGRYSETRGSWLSSYDGPVNPTHWMPLPEPPQEKGSGYWPEVPKNGDPDWTGFDG